MTNIDHDSAAALVKAQRDELRGVKASGGDVLEASTQQQEEVTKFAAALSEQDAKKFSAIYEHEMVVAVENEEAEFQALRLESEAYKSKSQLKIKPMNILVCSAIFIVVAVAALKFLGVW